MTDLHIIQLYIKKNMYITKISFCNEMIKCEQAFLKQLFVHVKYNLQVLISKNVDDINGTNYIHFGII